MDENELITGITEGHVVQSVDMAKRTVEFIISSETVIEGRGYMVMQDGWDFSAVKKNPVFLFMHDAYGMTASAGLPVGKLLTNTIRQIMIPVDGKKVKATAITVQFPTKDESELGDQLFKLYAGGYLSAVSVGFRIMQRKEPEKDGQPVLFISQRLIELSAVSIGADAEAMIVKKAQSLNKDPEEALHLYHDLVVTQSKLIVAQEKKDDVRAVGHFLDVGEHSVLVRVSDEEAFRQASDEITKRSTWYEEKRPVMTQATDMMVAFFEKIGEKRPEDLAQAFKRMSELVLEKAEKITQQPKTEPVAPKEAPTVQTRKPLVTISSSALSAGLADIRAQCTEAALEASRQGMSSEKVKAFAAGMYEGMTAAFLSNFSSH